MCLAGVPPCVRLNGVDNPKFGGHPVQLADLGGAGLARKGEVIATVLAPLDAVTEGGKKYEFIHVFSRKKIHLCARVCLLSPFCLVIPFARGFVLHSP